VEDIAVDHALSSILIVSEMRQRHGVHKRIGHGAVRQRHGDHSGNVVFRVRLGRAGAD
jgi:hypothetical protein